MGAPIRLSLSKLNLTDAMRKVPEGQKSLSKKHILLAMAAQIAKTNGEKVTEGLQTLAWDVAPTYQGDLMRDIQLHNNLLQRVNHILVDKIQGQKVYAGADQTEQAAQRKAIGQRQDHDLATNREAVYSLLKRTYDFTVPWDRQDQWRHMGNLAAIYREVYLQTIADERAKLMLLGTDALPEATTFLEVDRSFANIVAALVPGNIVSESDPGTGMNTWGDTRAVPLLDVPVLDNGDGTVTFSAPGLRFEPNAKISLHNCGPYSGSHLVHPNTTSSALVITFAFAVFTPDSTSVARWIPRFANLHELVSTYVELQPPEIAPADNSVWMARDVAADAEGAAWAGLDANSPSEVKWVQSTLNNYAGQPGVIINYMPVGDLHIAPFSICSYYQLTGSVRREFIADDHDAEGSRDRNYEVGGNQVEEPRNFIVVKNVVRVRKYEG